jgi:hypothetical protein
MNNKKTNNDLKHLENAIYKTPPASANDFTGYMPCNPISEEKSENISDMMNVPTDLKHKKTKH